MPSALTTTASIVRSPAWPSATVKGIDPDCRRGRLQHVLAARWRRSRRTARCAPASVRCVADQTTLRVPSRARDLRGHLGRLVALGDGERGASRRRCLRRRPWRLGPSGTLPGRVVTWYALPRPTNLLVDQDHPHRVGRRVGDQRHVRGALRLLGVGRVALHGLVLEHVVDPDQRDATLARDVDGVRRDLVRGGHVDGAVAADHDTGRRRARSRPAAS